MKKHGLRKSWYNGLLVCLGTSILQPRFASTCTNDLHRSKASRPHNEAIDPHQGHRHRQEWSLRGASSNSRRSSSSNNNAGGGTCQAVLVKRVAGGLRLVLVKPLRPFRLSRDHLNRGILAVPAPTATEVVVTATQAARPGDWLGPSVVMGSHITKDELILSSRDSAR